MKIIVNSPEFIKLKLDDGSIFMLTEMYVTKGVKKRMLQVMLVGPATGGIDIRPKSNNVIDIIPSDIWHRDRKEKI